MQPTRTGRQSIVRFLMSPMALVQGMSGETASREISRRLSVDSTTPEERVDGADFVSNNVGLLIPTTMAVFVAITVFSSDAAMALQIVTAPLILLFAAFMSLARRTIPASRDFKRWKNLEERGESHLYATDKDSLDSIPRDADFLLPLVVATVATPLILISGVLRF